MVKFVVLFRESINVQKKDMVTDDIITENKTEFTQLFNGEEISELCNDFFLDFMEPNKFFMHYLNNSLANRKYLQKEVLLESLI